LVAWFYAGEAGAQPVLDPAFTVTDEISKLAVYKVDTANFDTLRVNASAPASGKVDGYDCFVVTDTDVYNSDYEAKKNFVPPPNDTRWASCFFENPTDYSNRTQSATLVGLGVQHGMNFVYFRARSSTDNSVSMPAVAYWFVDAQADTPRALSADSFGNVRAIPGPNGHCNPIVIPILMETEGAQLSYRGVGIPASPLFPIPHPVYPDDGPWTYMFQHDLVLPPSINAGQSPHQLIVWTSRDRYDFSQNPSLLTPWTVHCAPEPTWHLSIVSPTSAAMLTSLTEISGTAEAGSRIRLSLFDDDGQQTHTTFDCGTTSPAEEWECELPTLGVGKWRARVIAEFGGESRMATVEFNIISLDIRVEEPEEGKTYPGSFRLVKGTVSSHVSSVAICLGTDCTSFQCNVENGRFTCDLGNLDNDTLRTLEIFLQGRGHGQTSEWTKVTFHVDGAKPTVTVQESPTGRVLTFISSKPENATFWCSDTPKPQVEFEACPYPYVRDDLTEGTHTLYVYAKDKWDQAGQTLPYSWSITGLPTGTLVLREPVDGEMYPAALDTVKGDVSEDITGIEVKLCWTDNNGIRRCKDLTTDNGACEIDDTDFTFTCDLGNLNNGTVQNYEITVKGYVDADEVDSHTVSFGVDGTFPVVTVVDSNNGRRLTFTTTKPGPSAEYRCKLEGIHNDFVPCTSPMDLPDLPPGDYTIYVYAIDGLGQKGETVKHEWEIAGPPSGTLVLRKPQDGKTYPGTTFDRAEGDVADDIDEVKFCIGTGCTPTELCDVDRATFAFVCEFGLLDDDVYEITVAGYTNNVEVDSHTVSFTVDGTLPKVTVVDSNNGRRLTFTSDKPNSTFYCSDDNVTFVLCTSPLELPNRPVGPNTIYIYAVDELGQKGETETHNWEITSPLPGTLVLHKPENGKTYAGTTFDHAYGDVAADINEVKFCIGTGCTPTELCEIRANFTFVCKFGLLADGTHEITVTGQGVTAVDSHTVSFVTDATLPVVTAQDSNNGRRLTFTSSKPNSTFYCSDDNVTFALCTSPLELPNRPVGPNTIYIYAVDELGQQGETLKYDWEIPAEGGIVIPIRPLPHKMIGGGCSSTSSAPLALLALALWALARRRQHA